MKVFYQKGIALLEVLVVLSILAVLFLIVIPQFQKIRDAQSLKSYSAEIFSAIEKAKSQSIASLNGSSYGIYFESDKITLFTGTSYNPNALDNQVFEIESPVSVSNISFASGQSFIYFNRLTGYPNTTGSITLSGGENQRVISVNTLGVLSLYTPEAVYFTLNVISSNGTVSSSPSGISCGGDCDGSYLKNSTVALTASPSLGYSFSGWSGGGCSGTGTCYVSITEDKTVTANYTTAVIYNLDVIVSGSGVVTSSIGDINCGIVCSDAYNSGDLVSLTPTPNTNYVFSGWSGDCSGSSVCNLNMTSAKLVTATFSPSATMYDLTATFSNGTVSSSPSGLNCGSTCTVEFAENTTVTLSASPNGGYEFSGWSGEGCSGTGTCQVSMTTNRNVSASFTPVASTYTVTPISGSGGSSSPSIPQEVGSGETQAFTLTPEIGHDIGAVGGTCPSGSLVGSVYTTGSIVADCNVMFNFPSNGIYVVTPSVSGGNGSISPSGDQEVGENESQGFILNPDPGYQVDIVSGTCPYGSLVGNNYTTGNIVADCTVIASFEPTIVYYNVSVSAPSNGIVESSPSGISCVGDCSENYASGENITLIATADPGYQFSSWGGDCSGTNNTCAINNISSAKLVTATFVVEQTYPVVQAYNLGSRTSNTTSHTISLPTGVASGDLLIVFFSVDGNPTISNWPANWNKMFIDSSPNSTPTTKFEARYKIAVGGETNFSLTTSASEKSAHQSFRISGYTGTPQSAIAEGYDNSPNPPLLTPSWGNKKTLWFSVFGKETGSNITTSTYPTNYGLALTVYSSTDGTGSAQATSRRELQSGSEDPGVFTLSAIDYWIAGTVAIQGI